MRRPIASNRGRPIAQQEIRLEWQATGDYALLLLERGPDRSRRATRIRLRRGHDRPSALCTKCTQACSPSTVSRSGVAAVSSIAGVHRTPTKAGMSRSGTDSPYRPTPNIGGCQVSSQPSQTASVPHQGNMPEQPVLRQDQSVSARLSVCEHLGPTFAPPPDSTAQTPNGRAHADPASVKRYCSEPNRAGGWLDSLGNDLSDPHHLITVRAAEPAWARLFSIWAPNLKAWRGQRKAPSLRLLLLDQATPSRIPVAEAERRREKY